MNYSLFTSHDAGHGMVLTPFEVFTAKRKQEIQSELTALVPSDQRRKLLNLLSELERIAEALSKGSVKYVQAAMPIDAIVAYLDEARLPATENQIVDAVLAGGYKGGESARSMHEPRIRASINVHINGKGAQGKNALKKINDLIGMASWDDSLFQ